MQTILRNQANQTLANLGANVQVVPATANKAAAKLTSMVAVADQLRSNADTNYKQYVIAGRDALTLLMGDVYALYCEIKTDENDCKAIIKHMAGVVTSTSQVRTTSTDASVLVRYICREMSDKKVSVYSRCIALAHTNKVLSTGLPALVKSTPNGWLGLLQSPSTSKSGINTSTGAEIAAQAVRKETTVANISAQDWDNDETVRVYIATYNDDSTADIRHAPLSPESINIVLKRYAADKKKLEKSAKEGMAVTTLSKDAILIFEGDIANTETEIGNLRAEIDAAVAAGQHTRAANQRDRLQVIELQHKGNKAALKAAKAAIKDSANAQLLS